MVGNVWLAGLRRLWSGWSWAGSWTRLGWDWRAGRAEEEKKERETHTQIEEKNQNSSFVCAHCLLHISRLLLSFVGCARGTKESGRMRCQSRDPGKEGRVSKWVEPLFLDIMHLQLKAPFDIHALFPKTPFSPFSISPSLSFTQTPCQPTETPRISQNIAKKLNSPHGIVILPRR